MKKLFLFLSVLTLLLSPLSEVNAKTLKFNNAVPDPEESDDGFAAKVFAKYLEEHSDGRIQVSNFYAGALGDEVESFRNVQKGSLAFAMGSIDNLVSFEKKLGVLTLPYIYEDFENVKASTTGPAHKWTNDLLIAKGFRVIAWVYNGYRHMSNSVRPVHNINDVKGLKIRIPANAITVATMEAFGASPTPIAWSETFTALQQNVVDGQVIAHYTFRAMKFDQANQKYISELHNAYLFNPIVMSERVFRKLSKEDQQLLLDAGAYTQQESLKNHVKNDEFAKEDLKSKGVQIFTLTDEDVWKQRAYDLVWPEMVDFVGGEAIINSYLNALGRDPWKAPKK